MTDTSLKKLVIIGVGLIGGSFALALRNAKIAKHIVGVGRSQKNLQLALELGIIDTVSDDLATALQQADAVLLAMPVGQTTNIMAQIVPHLENGTIITDVGSTKQDVAAAAQKHLGQHLKNFVPAHPIAGSDESGAGAATANLFHNKHLVLTPLDETSSQAVQQVTSWWQHCGAQVSQMSAKKHDQILAATSHLPHVLAFTLMSHLRTISDNDPDGLLRFAGKGFIDFIRIAGSSPEMWRDICLANREELLKQINIYQQELTCVQTMLNNNDEEALKKAFIEAQEIKKTLDKK